MHKIKERERDKGRKEKKRDGEIKGLKRVITHTNPDLDITRKKRAKNQRAQIGL